jgi:hypothetical protein
MFKVCKEPCAQCLFSKNRIVSAKRVKEILTECKRRDIHFVCHKSSMEGGDVCCRTFFDTQNSQMIRIAERLNMVEFVDPTKEETNA